MKRLLYIAGFLMSLAAHGQTIQYLGSPTTQIYVRGQLRIDSIVYLPLRDTTFTPSQVGAMVIKSSNGGLYLWNGLKWNTIPTGSTAWGTLTGFISNQTDLINLLNGYQPLLTQGYGIKLVSNTAFWDSANVRKVDTVFRTNDSTLTYAINGHSYSVLLRGTAAGGINSLSLTVPGGLYASPVIFSNTGGAWTGVEVLNSQLAGSIFSGPASGSAAQPTFRPMAVGDLPIGIPNANLQNSSIGLSLSNAGTTPTWGASSVALGGTAVFNLPFASSTTSGIISNTDWINFNNATSPPVTSVNGQIGTVVTLSADSIKKLPIDTSSRRNGYALTFDSLNHKWVLAPGSTTSGTVTSVGMTVPSFLTVSGSPITTSGTFAIGTVNQSANTIWAGPASGSSATPAFRGLANADFPTSGVSAGTYNSLTVNAQGIVTGGSIVGSGITSLNGLTGTTQVFGTGTAGSDFNISSVGTTHTFNFPDASASSRGLLTSADWTTFNTKPTFQQTLDKGNALNKSDTINQNGNQLYFTGGGTLLSDSVTFTPNPVYLSPTGLSGFSNSFGVGQNSTNNFTKAYLPLLAANYNLPLTNYSVSGTGIWTATSNHLLNINIGNSSMSVVEIGFNDLRYAGGGTKTLLKLCNGINAIFANQFLKSWLPGGSGSASVVRSGSWSALYASQAVGGKSNGNGAFTSTINDSLVYTFSDSTVTLGLIGQDGITNIGATFDVYIDNVLQGHYTENNQYDGVVVGGTYDNKRGPMSLFFTGLTNATHKIKLVNTAATGTAFFIVDYVGNLLDKRNTVPLVIYEIPKMDATGYATSPANSTAAITNTANNSIDSTVALFPVAYPVYLAKTNNFYTFTNPLTLSSDHIHPTDSGHVQIALAAEAVIALAPAPASGTLMYLNGDLYLGLGNGQKTKVSRQSPAAAGAQNNVQYNVNGFLSASSAFNFVPSTNYLGVGPTTPATALDISNNVPTIRVSDSTTGINNAVYLTNFQDVGIIGMNRNPGTGVFKNTAKAAANIQLTGNTSTSFIDFLTANAVNTVPSTRGRMFGNGNLGWGSSTDNSTALMQISGASAQLALHRDATHYTLFQTNSDGTFVINPTGITTKFVAPTTAGASINLIPSSAVNPTSPNNGDLWYNGTNLDFRHGGVTTDLLSFTSALTQIYSKNSVSILGTDTIQLVNDVATPCKGCAYMARPLLDSAKGFYPIDENAYGILYQKATWANINDFTVNGTTASVVGNKIQLTGGSGTFTQTLDLKGATCLDKWQIAILCHATSLTGGSFGLGVGKRSTNSYGSPMTLARVNFATGGGQLITNGGSTPTQISSTTRKLTISANDLILIVCKRDGYQLITTARNVTTNSTTVDTTYTYSTQPNAQPYFDNTGTFSIFSLGGTMIVDSLCVSSDVVKNARLAIIGDSKVQGFDVTAQGYRWSDLLGKRIRSTINLGGGFDRTIDVSARVPEIIRLAPQQIIMSIGSNDVRSGVDSTTYCTRYDSIVTALTNAGIDVYHAVLYETSISMLPLWHHIQQVYAANHIIDTYDALQVPNVLDVDGVHPLNYGDSIAYNTTIQSYLLYGQNERYNPNGSEAMNWTSPQTINLGTQLGIPLNIGNFGAKNNSAQFGTSGIQSVAANNAFFQEGTHYNGTQQIHDITGFGEFVQLSTGDVLFGTAPSGAAGTAATYTTRMAVKNGGNVVVGNGATDLGFGKLQVLGSQGIAHYADATHFMSVQSDASGNAFLNASNGLVGISASTTPTAQLTVGSNRTGPNNGLGGLKLLLKKSILTDNSTSSSATVTNVAVNTIGQDSLTTAANTGITYTNAFTAWIEGSPVLTSTNPTTLAITNPYAFGIGSGKSLFGGLANYTTNFGSTFTDRSHVDKGYVDSAILAHSSNASSGAYVPTSAAISNVSSVTSDSSTWIRVGNIIHVEGRISITPTSATTSTIASLIIPVSSNIVNSHAVAGLSGTNDNVVVGTAINGIIQATSTANTVQLVFLSSTIPGACTFYYHYQYPVQ